MKKNPVIYIALFVTALMGVGYVYAKRKSERSYAAIVEDDKEVANGTKPPSRKYLRLSSKTAAAAGRNVAKVLLAPTSTDAQIDASLAAMLTLQKPSFLEVYWIASQNIYPTAKKDLIQFLENERFDKITSAAKVSRTLAVLVKRRYQGPATPPLSPLQKLLNIFSW
jgi:hypothetical protein